MGRNFGRYYMIMKYTFVSALALCAAGTAQAATLTFDEFDHSDIVNEVQLAGTTVTITADGNNSNSPDVAVAFDTELSGTRDPDLEQDLVHHLDGSLLDAGRVLIVQENPLTGPNSADDDGRGGYIMFEFTIPVTFLGYDIVDDATIEVTSSNDRSTFATLDEDNAWATVDTYWEDVTWLKFDFGEASGAIDNLRFSVPSQVPVPAAFPLLGGALAMLGWGARRRKG